MSLELPATFFFIERETSDDYSRRDTQRENAARPAIVEITHISKHTGQQQIAQPLVFPLTFRDEPHFTSGCATKHHPAPATWHDPIGNAGVVAWVRDEDGNFVGAKVWVRVDIYPKGIGAGAAPAVTTQHYFTFSGIAVKNLPISSMDPALTPRAVGL